MPATLTSVATIHLPVTGLLSDTHSTSPANTGDDPIAIVVPMAVVEPGG